MPNALIIGISNTLNHELNVRDSFLTYAPSGWDADIIMGTTNSDLIDNEYVVETLEMGGLIAYSDLDGFRNYISNNSQYDIIICSYILEGIASVLEAIVSIEDRILFMPLSGSSARQKNNIIYCGVGESSNQTSSDSNRIECFDKATLLQSSRQLTPSYVVPSIAGKACSLVDAGLTNTQVRQAFRSNLNDTWTQTDGFGKVPSSLTASESYDIEPVNAFDFIGYASSTYSNYTLFEGQSIDSVRIYMDSQLLWDGNGTKNTLSAGSYAPYDTRVTYRVLFEDFTYTFDQDDEGEHVFKAVAVKDDVESEAEIFSKQTFTLTQSILENRFGVVYETSEPEPDTETEEEPEEETPIVPDPTSPAVSRSGTDVTVTANELGTTQKLYRREKPSDDWELVDTATDGALTDTVDADKNYIYSVKINNGETESDYSEPSYLAGEFYGASVGVMV